MTPVSDWRVDDPAPNPNTIDLPGLAFEFLRRNADFRMDWSNRSTRNSEQEVSVAQRWGLRFRCRSEPSRTH